MEKVYSYVKKNTLKKDFNVIPGQKMNPKLYNLPGNAFKLITYIEYNKGVFKVLIRKNIYTNLNISKNAYYKALDDLEENNFLYKKQVGNSTNYMYYFDINGKAKEFYEFIKDKKKEELNLYVA